MEEFVNENLEQVVKYAKTLKLNEDLAVNKYYEIYRYLKNIDGNREMYKKDEYKCVEATVIRTKNWLQAHYNNKENWNK